MIFLPPFDVFCVHRLQSNNLGPELLALLLLPTMIKTAKTFAVTPRLVVLTSSLHTLAGPEDIVVFESAAEVHKTLSSAKHCTPRYGDSPPSLIDLIR